MKLKQINIAILTALYIYSSQAVGMIPVDSEIMKFNSSDDIFIVEAAQAQTSKNPDEWIPVYLDLRKKCYIEKSGSRVVHLFNKIIGR